MTKGYNLAHWLSTLASSSLTHTRDVLKFLCMDLHYPALHLMALLLHYLSFCRTSISLYKIVHVCDYSSNTSALPLALSLLVVMGLLVGFLP